MLAAPDPITHDRMEELLADKFSRYFLRTGPICTTKNSLPYPPSMDRGVDQFDHETEILYSQDL